MKYDVVLLPSYAEVESWRKSQACERAAGLFATTVTTFDQWIAQLWELYGDGRAIVGAVQREIAVRSVLERELGDAATPGLASLAVTCLREAAGLVSFERALHSACSAEGDCGLSARERKLLVALFRYEEMLEEMGFVEFGQACTILAGRSEVAFPRPLRVLIEGVAPLSWIEESFFGACSQLVVTRPTASGSPVIPRAPEGVEVRFAFPSGGLADPGLIAEIVRSQSADGDIFIACKDPLDVACRIEPELVSDGYSVCVQSSKPFSQTDFGRVFLASYHCVSDEPWNPASMSDVLTSPFSGVGRDDAREFDKLLRSDRLVSRDEAILKANALSESFSQLMELASDPDADVLIGAFEQMVLSMPHRGPSWQSEQLSAMARLRAATSAARCFHMGVGSCVAVLEHTKVPLAYQAGEGHARVLISSQDRLAAYDPGSCAVLVVSDLTSDDYPVADHDDAAATLFSTMGLAPAESALDRARREFAALLSLPARTLYLARPLGDENAAETYPAVTLEEFIDAYRDDPSATEDIDNPYRLPPALRAGLIERGEELLYANAVAAGRDERQGECARVSGIHLDEIETRDVPLVAPRRRDERGVLTEVACPSPSQVETYLECPYRWFATRKLGIGGIDEGFGPLELGSFAHAALEAFYRRFNEGGHAKVSAGNLEEARRVMAAVLDDLVEEQPTAEASAGRLVATTELERREVQALCRRLVSYLDYEARLLPAFHPAYLEYPIEMSSHIDYAGHPLVGTVDRIDVDGSGNAIVIDYKGSLNAEHAIAGKWFGHAGKVQTRIYARAVERALGVRVVAALYVSYGKAPGVSGAYDARVIDAAHLPGVYAEHCSCGLLEEVPDPLPDDFSFASLAFDRMLDETERLVGMAIRGMENGRVDCAPSHDRACSYCPVLACDKRIG